MGGARRELTPGPALEAALRDGVPPAVALVGGEEFLKEDALRTVRERRGPDVAVETFDGPRNDQEAASFDPAAVFDGVRTGFLFGGGRIVVVRRADRFVADHGDVVARILERPPSGATLVLFLQKIDGRRKLGKAIAARGLVVTCRPLYDHPAPWEQGRVPEHEHELGRWAAARARLRGKRMTLETAHVLTRHTGNDCGRIDGTLVALAAFVGERPEIDRAAVESLVSGAGEQSVFQLGDEVLEGDGPRALRTLTTMFRRGLDLGGKTVLEPDGIAMIVLSQLSRRLRDVYRARRALEGGLPPEEVLATLGPPRSFQDVFRCHLARHDAETLAGAIGRLREIEADAKTGLAPAGLEVLLTCAVADLCRSERPGPARAGRARGGRPWA